MTRYLTIDHAYDAAFSTLPHANHEEWFEKAVFGTCDFLDVALRAAGHEAKTLVANFFEKPQWPCASMMSVAEECEPDVVVCREASRWPGELLRRHFPNAKLVCTCSHRVEDCVLRGFDCIFTSFPWFVEHVRSLGIRCEYLPLAFGKPVLDRVKYDGPRDIPVCFIGGLGMRTWKSGTETMAAIAEAVPEFQWWGYVQGSLSDFPLALQKAYCGEAWGADMYRLLMRTKILVNRHGEIAARGGSLFGNNTRQYEATGCGCMLLTDDAGELVGHDTEDGLTFCATYRDAEDAIRQIRFYEHGAIGGATAGRQQEFVLKNHTFESRVPRFLSVIESL